ncbi:MAG: PAS domain S-box protein [Lachnospiraceae bacterium]|nr:PAS domain S-box protein [Lachnospiraceae bacterium]
MTNENSDITKNIIRDMDEGVIVLDRSGMILITNNRALSILDKKKEELEGRTFASVFFQNKKNDDFNQTILNAIYDPEAVHKIVSEYHTQNQKKYLHVITSGLTKNGKITGIIIMLSDISELVEVKEHLKMMDKIRSLNSTLEKRNQFIQYAFGRYLSDEIVEKIVDDPDGLSIGGHQSYITVLMSDIRGFTAICENMEPDSLICMLNHYFDQMVKIIKEMKGNIIEYQGDGILALFGDPVKNEKHAQSAVTAAILMQKEMNDINIWNKDHGYPELKMGIGINTGTAVVGNIGSEYAIRYNVIGSCINLCGRIESYTVSDQIFISTKTKDEIDEELIIEDSYTVMPKGVNSPITIHSVKGIGAPYNVSYKSSEEDLIRLENEVKARLCILDGKHVSSEEKEIIITAGSSDRIRFRTGEKLDIFDNVVIISDTSIYGKITESHDGIYIMSITGRN